MGKVCRFGGMNEWGWMWYSFLGEERQSRSWTGLSVQLGCWEEEQENVKDCMIMAMMRT